MWDPTWDDYNDDGSPREDGQVDGEGSGGAVEFAPKNPGQPWLRNPLPPWHLWGNTQRLTVLFGAGTGIVPATGQLVKIAYRRPESWQWLFSARLLSGPDSAGGLPAPIGALVTVSFGLTVGVGRSAISMTAGDVTAAGRVAGFETFRFKWGPVSGAFPRNAHLYSSEALAPNRTFDTDVPTDQAGNGVPLAAPGNPFGQSASRITQIVAQDIQLDCVVRAIALPGDTAFGLPLEIELSAAFAPKAHVRPDWFMQGPPESVFAGAETEGK